MAVTVPNHFTLQYGSLSQTMTNVIVGMLFYILSLPGCVFKVKVKLPLYGVLGYSLSRRKMEVMG